MEKRKLRNFQILKLTSPRLKEKGYKITLSLAEARRNDEVIKVGDNELVSTIRRVIGKLTDFYRSDEIEIEMRRISRLKNSDTNRELLASLREELDEISFVPELVAVQFADTRHYGNILTDGFFINKIEYVRVLAGAGNIRRNTVMFVDHSIYEEVMVILDNGRDKSEKLNAAKLSAYTGLYGSAGHTVATPRFAVIADCELSRPAKLEWVNEDDSVEEVDTTVTLNITDGQGLVSPEWSKVWGGELGLDYIPSTFIIRAPFTKGQLATFDFKEFAIRSGKDTGVDIWGNNFQISEQDVILSESQFKMGSSYKSLDEFVRNMASGGLGFRVTRYSPRLLNSDTSSNYMFLQVLDLNDEDIYELSKDTIQYFRDVETGDAKRTALYLSGGDAFTPDFSADDFSRLDLISKAVLSYPSLLGERYISQRILSTLKKRESQAKLGKLFFEGNYSPLVSDPYAQCEALCGMEVQGLLKDDEHYSDFWNQRGESEVASARSPLTHNSELRTAKLKESRKLDFWYKYLDTVFILPATGLDTIFYADADFDGDLIFTSSSEELMKCRIDGNPISYTHGLAEKKVVTPEDIAIGDIAGMNSKIGFVTNISSTYHAMLYDFEKGSPEYNEIQRRKVLLRMYQGENIDSAKNAGRKREVPSYWSRWERDSSPMDKALVADKRPLFTVHLYDSYMKRYRDERKIYERHSWSRFGKSFQELLSNDNPTDDEAILVNQYYRDSFFIFSASPMNRISQYVTEKLDKLHIGMRTREFEYEKILSSSDAVSDPILLKRMQILFQKYSSAKKAFRNQQNDYMKKDIFYIISSIGDEARALISSSDVELGDLAVSLMMKDSRTRSFGWTVFGEAIVENILNRHGRQVSVLTKDIFGDESFLFENYSERRVFV